MKKKCLVYISGESPPPVILLLLPGAELYLASRHRWCQLTTAASAAQPERAVPTISPTDPGRQGTHWHAHKHTHIGVGTHTYTRASRHRVSEETVTGIYRGLYGWHIRPNRLLLNTHQSIRLVGASSSAILDLNANPDTHTH